MVYIYAKGEQIALHPRERGKGGYTTCKEHLCSHHRHYLDRSPEYYMNKAKTKSKAFGQLFEQLFEQDKYPEQLYRTCDGLLSIQRKTEPKDFEKACNIALENNNYSYYFISNIIKNGMAKVDTETAYQKPLPFHKNTRGAGYYK